MGYTTEFIGRIKIDPPLSQEEGDFLRKFNTTRRMHRQQGPYFVDGGGFRGQDMDGVIDSNHPPDRQPGLWCRWKPSDGNECIQWDGGEKFYDSEEWMQYLIDHFIGSNPIAKSELPFLQPHVLNGEIEAQGEDPSDKWTLIVKNNEVSKKVFVFSTPKVICPHCEEEFYLEQAE